MLPSGCFLVIEMKKVRNCQNFSLCIFFLKPEANDMPFLRTTRQIAADHRLRTADLASLHCSFINSMRCVEVEGVILIPFPESSEVEWEAVLMLRMVKMRNLNTRIITQQSRCGANSNSQTDGGRAFNVGKHLYYII